VDFPVGVALAELVPALPVGAGWRYEMKLWAGFDLVRCPHELLRARGPFVELSLPTATSNRHPGLHCEVARGIQRNVHEQQEQPEPYPQAPSAPVPGPCARVSVAGWVAGAQQPLPCQASRPSLTAMAAITRAAIGSAQDQPRAARAATRSSVAAHAATTWRLAQLSHRWGTRYTRTAKIIWAEQNPSDGDRYLR
jgi:hypothetical protein